MLRGFFVTGLELMHTINGENFLVSFGGYIGVIVIRHASP
jgi:hypothetical protein